MNSIDWMKRNGLNPIAELGEDEWRANADECRGAGIWNWKPMGSRWKFRMDWKGNSNPFTSSFPSSFHSFLLPPSSLLPPHSHPSPPSPSLHFSVVVVFLCVIMTLPLLLLFIRTFLFFYRSSGTLLDDGHLIPLTKQPSPLTVDEVVMLTDSATASWRNLDHW